MKFSQIFSGAYKSRFSGIMTVLLVITAICSIYYFYYLEERENVLDKHYRNSLRHVENRMSTTCLGYRSMANANAHALFQSMEDLYSSGIKNNDTLIRRYSEKINRLSKVNNSGLKFTDKIIEKKNEAPANQIAALKTMRRDSLYYFSNPANIGGTFFSIRSVVSIRNILRSTSQGAFDELVLTCNDTILYESTATGFRQFIPDSLDTRNESSAKNAAVPIIRCGGISYRCYELPVQFFGEKGWKLTGLVSQSRFDEAKHHMPRAIRFSAFLLVIIVVLAIPFLKIMIMSRTERLKISDVIFAVFSFLLSISLVTVLLFDGYLQYDADISHTNSELKTLSNKLDSNLHEELSSLYKGLNDYKTSLKDTTFVYTNYKPGGRSNYGNLFLALTDSNGITCFDAHDSDFSYNVSKRKYISDIIEKKFCYLDDGNDSMPYVIESITSWREGKQRMAFSIPCPDTIRKKKTIAAVITTDLLSMSHPVIPRNSGFCIIDDAGEVLAHSDSSRILAENFLEETDHDPYIEAAIRARKDFTCTTQYAGVTIRLEIRPIKGSPYFLVAYVNTDPLDAIHGQVFGMAMVLATALILVYLIIAFLIYFTGRKRSRLNTQRYNFRFFLPGYHTENQFYLRAVIFNFSLLMLMCSVSLLPLSPLLKLFLFFGSPIAIILYNYLLTAFSRTKEKFKPAGKYIILIISGVCAINLPALHFLQQAHFGIFMLYQLIAMGLFVFALKIPLPKTERPNNRLYYRILVFFLILLITVLPTSCFTVLAYNTENQIAVKAVQYDLIHSGIKRNAALQNDTSFIEPGREYMHAFYDSREDSCTCFSPETDSLYQSMCALIRGNVQKAYTDNLLFGAGSSDSSWSWGNACDNSGRMLFEVKSHSIRGDYPLEQFRISSQPRVFHLYNFGNNDTWGAFTAWLVFLFMLMLLFYILHLFIRHMFPSEAYQTIFGNIDKRFFGEENPSYRIFVIGVPCCGKTRYFEKLLSGKDGYQHLDLIKCLDDKWGQEVSNIIAQPEGVLLIDHFEYDCLNPDVNKIKLKLLEQLAGLTKKRVVIISSIPIQGFLDIYEPYAENEEPGEKAAERLQEEERWKKVLGNYYNFWFPIRGMNNIGEPRLKQRLKSLDIPEEIKKTITEECDHGFFLRKIGEELCLNMEKKEHRNYNRHEIRYSQETIVLKVQQIAHSYYLSIWSQLTKEEQYVLFDIAQDGLVNPKNSDVVEILIRKGLVVYGNSVQPMNRSFQNFILTVVETSNLMKLEHSKRNAGNWERLRKPLLIAVAALILFILKTDQSETFTWITGFAAGVPLVINLLGSIMKGEVVKE